MSAKTVRGNRPIMVWLAVAAGLLLLAGPTSIWPMSR
jgi:hypothetical protein